MRTRAKIALQEALAHLHWQLQARQILTGLVRGLLGRGRTNQKQYTKLFAAEAIIFATCTIGLMRGLLGKGCVDN
jgi:hypothetical protein